MNGIEKITARIETDAKAETAEILREAEEKAAAVRAQYEAQAKQEAEEAKKPASKPPAARPSAWRARPRWRRRSSFSPPSRPA